MRLFVYSKRVRESLEFRLFLWCAIYTVGVYAKIVFVYAKLSYIIRISRDFKTNQAKTGGKCLKDKFSSDFYLKVRGALTCNIKRRLKNFA